MSEPRKKIIGPLEAIVLIVVLVILAYIGLKRGDGYVLQKTEEVQIIDNAGPGELEKQSRSYEAPQQGEDVEAILKQIANQYAGGLSTNTNDQSLEQAGMSEDEIEYLEEVKERTSGEKKEEEAIDWFGLLRASHKTYTKVKSAFEEAGIDVEKAEDKVTSKLVDEVAGRSFYRQMEDLFGIPQEESRAFAKKGEKAISDWARFVEESTQ